MRLQILRVLARQKAVAQGLKANASLPQLLLGPLVAIETHLDIERKVGADLDEEQPKVFIQDVEVVMRDPDFAPTVYQTRLSSRDPYDEQCNPEAFSCALPISTTPLGLIELGQMGARRLILRLPCGQSRRSSRLAAAANCSTACAKALVTGGNTIGEGIGKPNCSRMKVINPPGSCR